MSPVAPPSVFQGPRFMTSEYNSKYLKEPSNQPGGRLSELVPPSHYTSLPPTPGGTLWDQSWHSTKETPVEDRQAGRQAALGTLSPQADISALGLPTPKGQLARLAGLFEPDRAASWPSGPVRPPALPLLSSSSALESGVFLVPTILAARGLQVFGARSLPIC